MRPPASTLSLVPNTLGSPCRTARQCERRREHHEAVDAILGHFRECAFEILFAAERRPPELDAQASGGRFGRLEGGNVRRRRGCEEHADRLAFGSASLRASSSF